MKSCYATAPRLLLLKSAQGHHLTLIPDEKGECSDKAHNPVDIPLRDYRSRANANADRTGPDRAGVTSAHREINQQSDGAERQKSLFKLCQGRRRLPQPGFLLGPLWKQHQPGGRCRAAASINPRRVPTDPRVLTNITCVQQPKGSKFSCSLAKSKHSACVSVGSYVSPDR